MRAVAIIATILLGCLAAPLPVGAQQTAPQTPKPFDAPVWTAAEMGRHIAETMAAGIWADDANRSSGLDAGNLRVQLQVLEAHAVGQGLSKPFDATIARQAFKGYFEQRFDEKERPKVFAQLNKWGIAYTGAIQLGEGQETATLGYISHVFANAVETDEKSDLAVWAASVWNDRVDSTVEICEKARLQAIVTPE